MLRKFNKYLTVEKDFIHNHEFYMIVIQNLNVILSAEEIRKVGIQQILHVDKKKKNFFYHVEA